MKPDHRARPTGAGCGTVFLLLLCLFPGCRRDGLSTHSVRKERIAIAKVKRGPFIETISVTGKILPVNIVYLDALEGGRVEKIFTEAGSIMFLFSALTM